MNGRYEYEVDSVYHQEHSAAGMNYLYTNNAFDLATGSFIKRKKDSIFKADDLLQVEILVVNEQEIILDLKRNHHSYKREHLRGKLNEGMFELESDKPEISGIPYFLGSYAKYRRRIGISKSGDLIINEAYNDGGAILFIFGHNNSGNRSYRYKRVRP